MPSPTPPLPTMRLRSVNELVAREIAWLWPGRLALGKRAILDGDPGLGKSLLTLDLCARLSTGQPFADASPSPGPGSALVLNGEDGAEDTIRPRLRALGADNDRVFVLNGPEETDELLRLPAQTRALDDALARTQARLVVIDPVVAFLDRSVNTSNDASVRRALFPLAALADKHRCAMLLVRHLNKSGGLRSVYRGNGSIGFLGACRSAWLLARAPDEPEHRVLAQVKNNLAAAQPSLAFTLLGEQAGPVTLSWLGPSPWAADQLLAGHTADGTPSNPRERARDFLAGLLEDGPRTSYEIWQHAEEQGLTERTLNRAKRELDIRSKRVVHEGRRLSYWLLPDQKLPKEVAPEEDPDDLEPWLAPLRKKYPPSTPLDDL